MSDSKIVVIGNMNLIFLHIANCLIRFLCLCQWLLLVTHWRLQNGTLDVHNSCFNVNLSFVSVKTTSDKTGHTENKSNMKLIYWWQKWNCLQIGRQLFFHLMFFYIILFHLCCLLNDIQNAQNPFINFRC